jgi:tRNA-2-methylthio-N6-dimethylallyladenosine synthase
MVFAMPAPFDVRLEALAGLRARPEPAPNVRTFYLETFGCQMNVHDSEKVAGLLLERGYQQVEDPDAANLIFYNTCSIREKAAQKLFSRLGEQKSSAAAGKVVGVLGCVAQQEGERIFERAPWVGLVCGSASYRKLPTLLAAIEAGARRVTGLELDTDETFETELTRRDNPFRAYLTIIEGCDKRCAFCVVPFTRGPERSRASDSILEEVRWLAAAGYSEVQLLGQTVDSYRDPSERRLSFAGLLRAVARVSGIRRVRFTTSHPRDFGQEIVRAIEDCREICEHVHLPVQAGSNRVLERMGRGYTREDYLARIRMIRAARRPISITTDVIVGFPGETETDFEQTLELVERAQYDGIFAFKYSPRPNTPALAMPGQIPEEEKGRRLRILLERQREIQTARNEALVGQTVEVLVDGRHDSKNQWAGRTSSNRVVNFTSPRSALLGEYVQVVVERAGANSVVGVHVG